MTKNKKSLCLLSILISTLIGFAGFMININYSQKESDSENEEYSLHFDSSEQNTGESFTKKINSGSYYINFKQKISNKITVGKWRTLYPNDYIYVTDASLGQNESQQGIKGIKRITFDYYNEPLKISYGWKNEEYEIVGDNFPGIYYFNGLFPKYFKIYNDGKTPIDIKTLTIVYSCENIYPSSKGITLTYKGVNQGYSVKAANKNITEVYIPTMFLGEIVNEIELEGFAECSKLTEITIPNSISTIHSSAFLGCTGLTSITIPRSLSIIEENTFKKCSALKEVNIPNTITTIGNSAFSECTSLKSVTIPESVTSIGERSFSSCSSLESISVDSKNSKYDSRDNSNAIIEASTNKLIVGSKNTIIPNSVTSIGNYAFSDCTPLTSISIPNSVTSIGNYAFSGCTSLTSISIPNSVTSIGNYAFSGCTSLTSISIPNSVISIGGSAFNGCTSLTSISISNSVTSIGLDAFSGCSSLESIVVDSNNSIYDSRNNSNAIIETSKNELLLGCKNTSIPDTISTIGVNAFYGCSSLKAINFPSNLSKINDNAFRKCTSLSSLFIPSSITSISNSAFIECSGLETISVDNNNPIYGSGNNSNSIIEKSTHTLFLGSKNTVIGEDITIIGKNAFWGCTGLTNIAEDLDSILKIEDNAFRECISLQPFKFGLLLESIGNYAFLSCKNMTYFQTKQNMNGWGQVQCGTDWHKGCPAKKIACSDGAIYFDDF